MCFLQQLAETAARLGGHKAGTRLVTAEERSGVERSLTLCMDTWAKKRRTFRAIWCVLQRYNKPCDPCAGAVTWRWIFS